MITNFKIFENENKSISFISNELVPYYEEITDIVMSPWIGQDIGEFLEKLLMEKIVEFSCLKCLEENKHGWGDTIRWTGKKHKGLVRGVGYGYNYDDKIYLTLTLNRVKYSHNVDPNKPITVYGDIPDKLLGIINGTNMLSNMNKYNL